MVNQKYLFVRLTKNQKERIRVNAEAKGYKTISSYIRALALENDLGFEKKFNEIYRKIVPTESIQEVKEKPLTHFIRS